MRTTLWATWASVLVAGALLATACGGGGSSGNATSSTGGTEAGVGGSSGSSGSSATSGTGGSSGAGAMGGAAGAGGSGPSCGAESQPCCSGTTCNSGLVCQTSGSTSTCQKTGPAGTCTPCSKQSDCGTGFCVPIGGGKNVCTTSCKSDADCVAGWTCGAAAGATSLVCQYTPTAETCFSHGLWNVANTSLCFDFTDGGHTSALSAVSTVMNGGVAQCPASVNWSNPTSPSSPWSTDTLKTDCTGEFKLCYTIKALSTPNGPQQSATDCVVQQVCTQAHYNTANQTQSFPDLPGWATATSTEQSCVQQFVTNGGYAEMSVDGQSDECQNVSRVFQIVRYCPQVCDGPNAPALCATCVNGGGGQF